jgi:hypothetical protein
MFDAKFKANRDAVARINTIKLLAKWLDVDEKEARRVYLDMCIKYDTARVEKDASFSRIEQVIQQRVSELAMLPEEGFERTYPFAGKG